MSRIIEILDAMDIIKFHEMKRQRHKNANNEIRFSTTPKIFADYRHFTKDTNGISVPVTKYDYNAELQKQIELMKKENNNI